MQADNPGVTTADTRGYADAAMTQNAIAHSCRLVVRKGAKIAIFRHFELDRDYLIELTPRQTIIRFSVRPHSVFHRFLIAFWNA